MKSAYLSVLAPNIDAKVKPGRRFQWHDRQLGDLVVLDGKIAEEFMEDQRLGAFMEDYIGLWVPAKHNESQNQTEYDVTQYQVTSQYQVIRCEYLNGLRSSFPKSMVHECILKKLQFFLIVFDGFLK